MEIIPPKKPNGPAKAGPVGWVPNKKKTSYILQSYILTPPHSSLLFRILLTPRPAHHLPHPLFPPA
jgi:hypothetical protein